MKIALHDSDKTNFPNLALMKLSAWHKKQGDQVEWYEPLLNKKYDKIYSSKVFTFTKEDPYLVDDDRVVKGGTGYDVTVQLPDEVEHIMPDYSLYDCDCSYGFTTRGCPNKCAWCIVPDKEGKIKKHQYLHEFMNHPKVILMDNNILAHEHGIKQLERVAELGVYLDINQGIDARLIDDSIAKLLSKITWLFPVRLACDSFSQMDAVFKAVQKLRYHNVTPSRYFCYVLVKNDIKDALERVKFLKTLYLDPFAQPYRDFNTNTEPSDIQKKFARWVNHKAIFKRVAWEEYLRTNS